MLARIAKPHYALRPDQLVRRSRLRFQEHRATVRTAWGDRLEVFVDPIGRGIGRMGVHELSVSEVMWRLSGGDDLAIDVGANVGYFTALLSRRASRVVAFEPNPRLTATLRANKARLPGSDRVELREEAVSDREGTASLFMPEDFCNSLVLASLEVTGAEHIVEVTTVTLDGVLGHASVGVLKIDVEGHEVRVLRGAHEMLKQGRVRDVIFEDHQPLPSPASDMLVDAGYTIFGIGDRFGGPKITAPERRPGGWDAPMYLATRDPLRARCLLSRRGWHCLRPRR
jgi:FkbM family methyltransferase